MLSTEDKVFVPELYFSRDNAACDFLVDCIKHQESCAAISMPDNGKNYLFINVVKRLNGERLPHSLEVHKLFTDADLQKLLHTMKITDAPTAYIMYVDVAHDISWFVYELSSLRKLKGHSFVTCLFCHAGNVWQALLHGESAVMHAQVQLKPVSFVDAVRYIDVDAARFDFTPNTAQKRDIYRWSYGHVGLIKTLMLLKRQYPVTSFTADFLLGQPPVVERLQKIIQDLPDAQKQSLLSHKFKPAERALLESFGYLDKSGNAFHPLLHALIARGGSWQSSSALSPAESRVLTYFQAHPGVVVPRDDVARAVWGGEDWQDKYSDWAIGQLIYRLRKKLEYGSSSGRIETRKGRGFEFIPSQGIAPGSSR